ncbi:MAG: NTP transferase domain-containing protein, partial [Burkholderiales bacterium]
MALEILILAAGLGKRMRSDLPKVLHPLAGRPLLGHVIETARSLAPRKIIGVLGHGAELVKKAFPEKDLEWVLQAEPLGTAHAVMQAMPRVSQDADVLILYGDVPLVRAATLKRLHEAGRDGMSLLTAEPADPAAYGRIVRDAAGRVAKIVEQRDASPAERAIREINAGLYALDARRLAGWLKRIDNRNAQKEYYLTDLVALAVDEGLPVAAVKAADAWEAA